MELLKIIFAALMFGLVTIRTAEGDESPVIAQCNFPFIFMSKVFTTCTKEGRNDSQLWCSTTPNYERHGQWIFCDQHDSYQLGNSRLLLVSSLCLGFAILCVCIAGFCMKVHWRGIQSGLWWSSRRVQGNDNKGKEEEDITKQDTIYENIEFEDINNLTHV
ncbi:uncharacterized protein [Hyperolius riggenbachi]|uniref:uncharacterized protein isoform X2 n=1 Tax=Hyperolius riggenbachi TaxID=752182 RepID=UPI0035A37CDA